MESHIKVLGWLYIIMGLFGVAIAAVIFVIMFMGGILSQDGEALAWLSVIAVCVSGFVTLTSLPNILAGWGLLMRKSWARILALVMGVINLPGFPTGTLLGVYTLYVLLDDETSHLFAAG